MVTIVALLVTLLSLYYIVIPVMQYNRYVARREWEEELKYFKLRAVKRYYPALRDLSYSEIQETYNVDAAYDNIGR